KVDSEVAIDRIFSGREELPHECLVDDGDVLRQLVVAVCEVAAANELHAEVLEVMRTDAVPRRADVRARRGWRLAGDEHGFAPVVRQRVVECETGASHTGDTREPRFDVAVEGGEAIAGHRGRGPADPNDHPATAIEAEVLPFEVAEAASEHRRSGDENH